MGRGKREREKKEEKGDYDEVNRILKINPNLSSTLAFAGLSFIGVKLNGCLSFAYEVHVPATKKEESYCDTKTNEEYYYDKKTLLPSVI